MRCQRFDREFYPISNVSANIHEPLARFIKSVHLTEPLMLIQVSLSRLNSLAQFIFLSWFLRSEFFLKFFLCRVDVSLGFIHSVHVPRFKIFFFSFGPLFMLRTFDSLNFVVFLCANFRTAGASSSPWLN